MDRQMKGEYFKMKNHGLRRIFSLFLALFMVFTLLPTTALAEDTTGADETQPKTVVVDGGEKKTDPPAQEQPKNEDPPAPEEPKTFTVTYTDGVGGAVFDNEVHSNLSSGTPTPAFSGTPAREGYTFAGWNPAVAETVTANVTYVAQWEAGKTNPRRVTVPPIPDPGVAPAALNTGHKIDVRFTVLYVGDEFNIGYNYGSSEKTQFVCQYKTNHSDTASTNHTIAISDIKAAANRATVNSGYKIVGWSKESNANPKTWPLNQSGTTACNKGTTIYLVAKNPNPTTKYTYTLNYDANGGTGAPSADSWSTTDASIRYHSFTVKNTIPTREGYVFKGWKAKDGSDTIYTGGTLCSVSQQGNDVVKNGNTWTRTLYAVWEEDAPAQPTAPDNDAVKALLGENAVQIICTNAQIGHGSKTFGLIDGTFTVYHSNNRCEVVINSFSPYVNEFNAAVSVPAGTHITDNSMAGQNRTKINLVWSDGKWTAADAPAKYHVQCSLQPANPTVPGEGDLENIEKLVRIVCDRNIHEVKEYGVIAGSCEFGDIDMTGDVPTCPVTIQAAEYVKAYNGTIDVEHTITGDTERLLILAWDANNNVWRPMTDTPVTFTVICPPAKPGAEDLAKLEAPVEVACTTKPETHAAAQFSLRNGTYTIGNVAGNETDGYTCDITVTADRYVAWYNLDYGKHTLPGDNTKTLTLKYVEGQWAVDTPVTFTVICPPTKPGAKDLAKLETAVEVTCTTKPKAHAAAQFSLRYGTYTIGNVAGNETDGYTCDITVTPDDIYVALYNIDFGKHTLTGDNTKKTLKLKYEEGQWAVDTPVTFNVTCVAPPTFDDLKKIFDQNIFVECNTKLAHTETPYDLIDGSYTIEEFSTMTDSPTCTVVLHSREYVKLFNGTTKAVHTPEDKVKRVGLVLRDSGWGVANDGLSVVFQVSCVPDAPTDDYLKNLLNEKVKVACTSTTDHATLACDLLDGSYQGSGVQPDGNGGYTYTVTIAAAEYVKKYNTERQRNHSLVKDEPAEKPVTLVWNADEREWLFADANAVPVNFNVECLYTVTYEDGENGSVFKTVSFPNLKRGEATPTIEDPIRVGYKFAGWEPTVAATVTGDVTYTAQWKKVDTTFTVKYNDNVKGKAFKEQVYEDLEYNEETPDFYGTPKRSGYTFTGWKPVVADRVTKDVV